MPHQLGSSLLARVFIDHSEAAQPVVVSTMFEYLSQDHLTKTDSMAMRRLVHVLLDSHQDVCLIDANNLPDDNVLLELGIARSVLYLLNPLSVEKIQGLLVKAEQLNFLMQLLFPCNLSEA